MSPSAPSPSRSSLDLLAEMGYTAAVVEYWVPRGKTTRDLFGVIDILAVSRSARRILGVQATTANNRADRVKKCVQEPRMVDWLWAGADLEVWAWSWRGPRGAEKLWTLDRTPLLLGADGDTITAGPAIS